MNRTQPSGWHSVLCLATLLITAPVSAKHKFLFNVRYGEAFRQTMDVMLPERRSADSTPVVVFIHGGAWMMGDKTLFLGELSEFADSGFAGISINYRYASDLFDVHHPDLGEDVRQAIDFIVSRADEWQIDPGRIGLVGHSAGGHLSLLTAYTLNADRRIKACASWAGPLDFTDPLQRSITGSHDVLHLYMGFSLVTAADTLAYRSASPYYCVHAASVPTLLVYGTEDIGVPYANALRFDHRLDSLGVPHRMITLQGENHIWIGKALKTARHETIKWFSERL